MKLSEKPVKDALTMTTTCFTHGAKVAGSTAAKDIIVSQLKKALGNYFPVAFYNTPIGKTMMDTAACFLIHTMAGMFPEAPGASVAQTVAALATEGVGRDGVAPIIELGTNMLNGVATAAGISNLLNIQKQD